MSVYVPCVECHEIGTVEGHTTTAEGEPVPIWVTCPACDGRGGVIWPAPTEEQP